jgi:inosose dehydratase
LKMLEKYGNRVAYVHLKDVNGEILVRALEEHWSFHRALKAYIFAKLGDGIVNIPSVIQALTTAGYDGWVVLEQDTTPGNPTEVANENRVYLESLLR